MSPENRNILLIQDNQDLLLLQTMSLEGSGHAVVATATTAAEAMRRIEQMADETLKIDTVVTDFNLGRGSHEGAELALYIRRRVQPNPLIVAVTNAQEVTTAPGFDHRFGTLETISTLGEKIKSL